MEEDGDDGDGEGSGDAVAKDPLVVFACRHLWHKGCLEKAAEGAGEGERGNREGGGRFRCSLCCA